ncbi:Uncharacterized protein Rs2_02349 [Raphanus sativus]|uniref:Uncharacterized protein LOC108852965 isoform X1 n=1 Tax=Raphanus sativus TaxID=3726 RepID=A0A9W3DAE5_RAPSA|nr:uncharacterized protein LOC108852965 isoform X1 [Raphanus sativus]KAJ4916799.1 Uncharacterized protein Rs2_02349 [Raphanus sativus]
MGDIWACLISFFFLIALVGIIVYELASPAAEPLAMEIFFLSFASLVNSEKQTIKEERSPEPDTEKQSIKGERSPELVSLEIDNLFGFLAPSRRNMNMFVLLLLLFLTKAVSQGERGEFGQLPKTSNRPTCLCYCFYLFFS